MWLCDIDGTIALRGDRDPYNWDYVGEDQPNPAVVTVVRALIRDKHEIGFLSGRKERARYQTELWLLANVLILPHIEYLWMRPDDDDRPDHVVKREIYTEKIAPYHDVEGVLDDRASVVAMWRSLGLPCLQVAEGNF